MATELTVQEVVGPYPTLPVSANDLDITFAAGDLAGCASAARPSGDFSDLARGLPDACQQPNGKVEKQHQKHQDRHRGFQCVAVKID